MSYDFVSVRGDEYYTAERTVRSIAEALIPVKLRVWCPCDEDWSAFVKVLPEYGHEVVNTSTDFFTTPTPGEVNCIITNPPFSKKKEWVLRCRETGLPFALLLPFMWLNDGVPLDYGHQLMFFRKRVRFAFEGNELTNPRANSFVLSNGLLKKDLLFCMEEGREPIW